MLLGYNTNGFAHHRLEDAVAILAELGYRSVALTLDHHAMNPYAADVDAQTNRIADLLHSLKLRCVVETGARFLLDPRRKHAPSLMEHDASARERRRDFLIRAIDVAGALGADAVSLWSGAAPHDLLDAAGMERLVEECRRLVEHAETRQTPLAFEPEPGMFIDTMARFETLHQRVAHPLFGLTLDVGHVHCLGDGDVAGHIERWSRRLFNVHLEDMRRGAHEHLMFGEGEMAFGPILSALECVGYASGVHVELSRHSHDAVETARRAMAFLRQAATDAGVSLD